VVAPVLWTGAVYGFMGVLNPALASLVDWTTFIFSQFVYGVVVGVVVVRSEMVYASQVFIGRGSRTLRRGPPPETRSGGNP
jgi:hypothetical protein